MKISVKNKEEYKAYLNSPRWQAIRKRLYREYDYKCDRCGSSKNIQVHHLTYENLGEEKDEDLVVLCQKCHSELHEPFNSIDYLLLAEGYAYGELDSEDEKIRKRAENIALPISEFIEAIKKIEIDGEDGVISVSFIRS